MTRSRVVVREAALADLDGIAALIRAATDDDPRVFSGTRRLLDAFGNLNNSFAAAVSNPELRLMVAQGHDDAIVGFAVLSEDRISALVGQSAVCVDLMVVHPDERHKGIGRAILTEAIEFAEQIDAEDLIVTVATEARDVNRYFARVGLAPMGLRRVAPVDVLRRAVGMSTPVVSRTARRRGLLSRFSDS